MTNMSDAALPLAALAVSLMLLGAYIIRLSVIMKKDRTDDVPKWRHSCDCLVEVGGSSELIMNLHWAWHWLFCKEARAQTRAFWGQYKKARCLHCDGPLTKSDKESPGTCENPGCFARGSVG